MSSLRAVVARRVALLNEAIDAHRAASEAEIAAIEVVPEDGGRRDDDLRLLREALDAGVDVEELEPLLVTVATNFAYEVDWKDHFCFWPKMQEHLRSDRLDLRGHEARGVVAAAFRRFTAARRGVSPRGEFARHFPLMSWPLVHAVMPWCAQRHVARVLDRAASMGVIPDDPAAPWPEGQAESIAATMRVPIFAMGIIENPTVLGRLGRALLGEAPRAESPGWVRRLRRGVEHDALTRDLVTGARESQRESVAVRGGRGQSLPVTLALHPSRRGAEELSLWASLGPYGRAVSASPDVLAFARRGAQVVARVNGADVGGAPLFNALSAPALVALTWDGGALTVQPRARPFEASDDTPAPLKRAEEGAARSFTLPLALRGGDDQRFVAAQDHVMNGERVAVLAARSSPTARDLEARGFTARAVTGAASLIALVGDVSDAVAEDLRAAHVAVKPRAVTLEPVLLPPVRSEGDRLVFRPGRDVWLQVSNAPGDAALRAEVTRAGVTRAAEVGDAEARPVIVRVPADALEVGANAVKVFAEGRARALASVEVVIERAAQGAGLSRWRVTLHPADATALHLLEDQCWLEVDSIPGVELEVELKAGARSRAAPVSSRGALDTSRLLSGLAATLWTDEDDSLQRAELRARALDEPDTWVTVAALELTDSSLRFDLTADPPRVVAPDDAPSLSRLSFGVEGVEATQVAPADLASAGVYLAIVGESMVALCVCDEVRRMPRLPRARSFPRSVERSRTLLSMLRAVDVAAAWPESSRAAGALMRRAAAREIERELSGTLCGRAWVEMEDEREVSGRDRGWLVNQIASLLWLDASRLQGSVDDATDEGDPLDLLEGVLELIDDSSSLRDARHLTLAFYRRGMTSRAQDEDAVRWAWSSVRRARAARACCLIARDAESARRAMERGDADA